MTIERHYEENITNGKLYKSIKVGLTIKSDKEVTDLQKLDEQSEKLLTIARTRVQSDLAKIRENLMQQEEGWS